jgi:hypothetical protein
LISIIDPSKSYLLTFSVNTLLLLPAPQENWDLYTLLNTSFKNVLKSHVIPSIAGKFRGNLNKSPSSMKSFSLEKE